MTPTSMSHLLDTPLNTASTTSTVPPSVSAPRIRGRRPAHGEPVVDRALSLLAAFDADHRALTLGDLSRRCDMPPSSASRLAHRLVGWGALERDSEGRYCIGLRLLEVATLAPRGHGLRQIALPLMHELAETTRQHVQLAVRDGMEGVLVERLSMPEAAQVHYRSGGRIPLHSTGIGVVLLAFAPPEVQETFLKTPVHREPDNQLIPAETLRRTLADVRRERLAVFRRDDEAETIVSVAAPIVDQDGSLRGALGVLVPQGAAHPRHLAPAVQSTARSISRMLAA